MSEFASVNDVHIVKGTITLPNRGCWHADLWLNIAGDVANPVSLVIGDLTMKATVFRSASYTGALSVRIVGGAGGWRQVIDPRGYGGCPASVVLNDAARTVGETVSLERDTSLNAFVRERGPASRVIAQLFPLLAPSWWIQPDGTTRIGTRDTSPIGSAFQALNYAGANGKIEVVPESFADWMPGRTFSTPAISTKTISAVQHTIGEGKIQTDVLITP